jgi:hypothetical protein
VKVILICLLCFCSAFSYAEDADEDITRTFIVVRLTNYIEWNSDDNLSQPKPNDRFKLCVYNSRLSTRTFQKHLETIKINNLAIEIENIVEKEAVSTCHALYLKKPSHQLVEWLVANNANNKTLLIVEGQGYAEQGVHLNIYLNKRGSFDLALNADAFVNSSQNIDPELLSLGSVVSLQTMNQSKLLSSLINYTSWPKSKDIFNASAEFQLCATKNNVFASFAHFYLSQKSIKGKSSHLKMIELDKIPEGCQIIFVDADKQQVQSLIGYRNKLDGLLIGHSHGLGEKGAHYNLLSAKNEKGRRFEVNLLAFKATGHEPDFQLINSALIVKNDYPSIVEILYQIVLNTNKDSLQDKSENVKQLCVFQEPSLYENLKLYLNYRTGIKLKVIPVELLSVSNNKMCEAIFIGEQTNLSNTLSLAKLSYPEALIITSQPTSNSKNSKLMPMHFNLLIKPNQVNYELFPKNLSLSGFILNQKFIGASQSRGDSND